MNLQTVKKLKKKFETAVDVLLEKRKGELAELNNVQQDIQSDIDELEALAASKIKEK